MEVGLVEKVDIDNEMQQAYLDYAMSVIVARAIPDARDGLKPVHRRILYAMYDMGLRPDTPYKKSARIVGEVLGKYHPHGDMAVYEAMARMAQDFSMRYQLVDGQGNFGSVDGDSPAAMRYTEARLAPPSINLLADIHKNTVNFSPNFDGSLNEPDVLPAAVPNMLVNGATGIAVGMSTSVPPHNLGEVVDALKYMLENWNKLDDINVEDLMRFIQGPDFPTGGVIIQEAEGDGLHSAYGSGRGRVVVQARARLEEMERGRSRIIVTELPYMTNKASLIERIAELVREERLDGIADLRDESDRQGMRIVIELSKSVDPEAVLRNLYKHTPMQSTFSIILLALVDGEPRLLGLKQALRVYLDHRLEIVRRRSQFDLERARQRAHILEGLRIALKNLDEVIDLIRKAPDAETARERLMKRFKLTEIQAQAILDLQLRRLASLERKKIELEYKEVQALIKDLEALLRSPAKMRGVIGEELQAVREAYGDRRRTQIVHLKEGEPKLSLLTATDLIPQNTIWVSVTREGLISRSHEDKLPELSGEEAPAWLLRAETRDILYLVCENGEAAAVAVHSLPEKAKPAEGLPFWRASALREGDRLAALFALPPKAERAEGWFVLTATHQGMVKKTDLSELPGPSANTFTLAKVNEGDQLGWLRLTHGQAEALLVTASGMAIRFSEEEVRPMGLVAAGVMGIKLQEKDELAGMEVLPQPGEVFLAASDGSAKRVPTDQFPRQGRYGQGVLAWKLAGSDRLVGLAVGKAGMQVILNTEKKPPKAIRLDVAPLQSRATRGRMIPSVKGDTLKSLIVPWDPPRPVAGGPLVGSGAPGTDGTGGGRGARLNTTGGEQGSKGVGKKAAPRASSDGTGEKAARKASPKASAGESRPDAVKKTAGRKAASQKTAAVQESLPGLGSADPGLGSGTPKAVPAKASIKTKPAAGASQKPESIRGTRSKAARPASKTTSRSKDVKKVTVDKSSVGKAATGKALAGKSPSTGKEPSKPASKPASQVTGKGPASQASGRPVKAKAASSGKASTGSTSKAAGKATAVKTPAREASTTKEPLSRPTASKLTAGPTQAKTPVGKASTSKGTAAGKAAVKPAARAAGKQPESKSSGATAKTKAAASGKAPAGTPGKPNRKAPVEKAASGKSTTRKTSARKASTGKAPGKAKAAGAQAASPADQKAAGSKKGRSTGSSKLAPVQGKKPGKTSSTG